MVPDPIQSRICSTHNSSNKRIKFARCACPTPNGEAPLLAAYAQR